MVTCSEEHIAGVLSRGMESLLSNSMREAIVCICKSAQISK
jgi:hypothetical protein